MLFFSRAACLAAIGLVFSSVAGFSSPGKAAELDPATVLPVTVVPAVATTVTPLATPAIVAPAAPHFASLDAALAAQVVGGDAGQGDESTRCLAGAIYFEAKGEPVGGQLAVAQVVLNRSRSGRFPSSVCGVVKQPGQFSFLRGGEIPDVDGDRADYRTALAVAKVAMAAAWDSPAPDALFFRARHVAPARGRVQVAAIGHHVFYR